MEKKEKKNLIQWKTRMPLIQHQKIYISQGNNMLRKGNKNKIKILGKKYFRK
jgi:hypothetical protein